MFRQMRRNRQVLTQEQCNEVLNRGTAGVLSVLGDDGYPYGVPLSYVYNDGKIYFHSAKSGQKLDAISENHKASFCVIDKDEVIPSEYTTYFRSVIVFGKVRILENDDEKLRAIETLSVKYAPNNSCEQKNAEIERFWNSLTMLELTAEHVSGKEAIELKRMNIKQ